MAVNCNQHVYTDSFTGVAFIYCGFIFKADVTDGALDTWLPAIVGQMQSTLKSNIFTVAFASLAFVRFTA
jgi:hypothetical protein